MHISRNKKQEDETPILDINSDELTSKEEIPNEDFSDEELNTFISKQASIFEEELRSSDALYDIPSDSDIPPRHNIQDDVEIITDRFEREVEDIYEGRR